MVLKPLRISRHLSQEQLAEMSGLSVRTIQRIESGRTASVESLKCLAAALDVDIETLKQEKLMPNGNPKEWNAHPLWLRAWFALNYLSFRPSRRATTRVIALAHGSGFLFCALGLVSEAALVGGLIMLASAYFFELLARQGDRYGVWYDEPAAEGA
jgi:transcriptional regulator with XRE-family HTH domain